ncbi:MAG: 2-oxoglutarate dehydrogenase complex dihydrolipoyllysine-residue succinyltransferase [bacterium]
MTIELTIPSIGESITEVQIGQWLKAEGDPVALDEPVVEIESEKATVELPSPAAGVLTKILRRTGETCVIGDVIAQIDEAAAGASARPIRPAPPAPEAPREPVVAPPSLRNRQPAPTLDMRTVGEATVMPAAQRLLAQSGIAPSQLQATGPGGRLLKEDAVRAAAVRGRGPDPAPAPATAGPLASRPASAEAAEEGRREWTVPMTALRRTIASRLVQAKQGAALLTTFNEIDMSEVIAWRKKFGAPFLAEHEIKLGFMSFFVKGAVAALRRFPVVNAEIRGTEIVHRSFSDIGIAVGGGKGLVVPVIRDAETKPFAALEREIADFGSRAAANRIRPDELEGGTFTISNGGVYGSLMSTPIPNPPQSGILGLHAIQKRPVVVDDEVVIRPMMYVALSYDHRIIDGREAVTFLKTIKEQVEQPARMLLEI